MIPSRWDADERLEALHQLCTHHRQAAEQSEWCGCFYCLNRFPPSEIEEWLLKEDTALCPHCGVDSVLPGNPDPQTLRDMRAYWFGDDA